MAKEKHLSELFHDTLKDIYFAEKKILGALPKMAKAAQSQELKAAFEKHEGETQQQVARLEQVFKSIGEAPKAVERALAHDGPVVVDVKTAREHISPFATIAALRG